MMGSSSAQLGGPGDREIRASSLLLPPYIHLGQPGHGMMTFRVGLSILIQTIQQISL